HAARARDPAAALRRGHGAARHRAAPGPLADARLALDPEIAGDVAGRRRAPATLALGLFERGEAPAQTREAAVELLPRLGRLLGREALDDTEHRDRRRG